MGLNEILQEAVRDWKKSGEIQSSEEINQGYCADFADNIISLHGEAFGLEFCDSDDLYRRSTLSAPKYLNVDRNGSIFKRMHAIVRRNINYKSSHVFLYSYQSRKFYDAEATEGVIDPLNLPIFKRFCDEVEQLSRFSA